MSITIATMGLWEQIRGNAKWDIIKEVLRYGGPVVIPFLYAAWQKIHDQPFDYAVLVALALMAVLCTAYAVRRHYQIPAQPHHAESVEKAQESRSNVLIVTPVDNEGVGLRHFVRGYVFPPHTSLQVLVYSGDGRWYVQPDVEVDGYIWSVECQFGNAESKDNSPYELMAVHGDTLTEPRYKTLPDGLIESNVVKVHRQSSDQAALCPNQKLHQIAENDRKEIQERLKLISVECVTHFGDVPYIDFVFWVYNIALVSVSIDDAIDGRIKFYKNRQSEAWTLLRRATIEENVAKNCLFRCTHHFIIRQEVSPEEAALIERCPDDSFFFFGDVKITMHGEGFSDVRFGTGFTVEKRTGLWTGHPATVFSNAGIAEPRIIMVKSALKPEADGGHPVALWEKNKAHPKGEAFVTGPGVVEVAETLKVIEAIRDGKIIVIE